MKEDDLNLFFLMAENSHAVDAVSLSPNMKV